ncbi:MAG TPA: BamA/TamA family outer membrane protein [Candidatus Binatia bacterium]|nr:BamA/TamA family outer membrane protein [Candidatus Binatia bacterium]
MAARQLSPRAGALIGSVLALALAAPVAALERSYIPIPEIITDPNEGNTFGILGVVLFIDERDEIKYMLAPDVRYNDTKGVFPTFRFFGYPSPARRYSIVLGKSTTVDEDYELEYTDRTFWDGRAFVLASFLHEKDSTERFFGFGNDSREDPIVTPLGRRFGGESNYTDNDTVAQATPGVWLLPYVNLSYRMRIRHYEVEEGQVTGIPFVGDSHPEARGRGLEGGTYWAHQTALTYDSRDSTDIPTHGALAYVYGEFADQRLGSHTSFVKFGADWRDFIPLRKSRNPILALRALANYTSGDKDTPWWELSSLGGRRALRGFGSHRFIDFNRTLGQAELRTRVYQRPLFGVNFELEVSPFLEAGQVFRRVISSPLNDLHWVYGVGFRGVVRPQIVGFVDVGRGSEGFSVFTGVDYPF